MRPTKLLQEIRKMRFEETYEGWTAGRLTQSEAARVLGICERSFRRYLVCYEANGLQCRLWFCGEVSNTEIESSPNISAWRRHTSHTPPINQPSRLRANLSTRPQSLRPTSQNPAWHCPANFLSGTPSRCNGFPGFNIRNLARSGVPCANGVLGQCCLLARCDANTDSRR